MKLDLNYELESTLEGDDTADFSIVVNAKSFRILIADIYSNKVRAALRELCTNAYDSHIEAGCRDTPFEIHLPTRLDPTFSVRDFGVSMDHEKVMGVYTTLFESTKDDSDDQVGALGLGSKVPFAYTDSFQIVTWLDGVKTTYLAALGGNGVPRITRLGREDSTEPQGVEVSFAVEPQDFAEFADEMKSLALGFDPVPNVDGVELETIEPVYVGNDGEFAIFPPFALPGEARLHVRQGCVLYPVTEFSLVQPLLNILNHGYAAVVNVPIGSVMMTASREALSLKPRTVETITDAIDRLIETVRDDVMSGLQAQPNYLSALNYWYKRSNGHDHKQIFSMRPTYRDKPLGEQVVLKGGSDWEIPKGHFRTNKSEGELRAFNFHKLPMLRFVVRRSNQKVVRAGMRYKKLVEGSWSYDTYLLTDPTPRQLERLVTLLGLKPEQIVPLASLPDPGPPVRTPSAKGVRGVYAATGRHSWTSYTSPDDMPDDYYYLVVPRMTKSECGSAYTTLSRHVTLGMKEKPVIFFTEKGFERFRPAESRQLGKACRTWFDANEANLLEEAAQWQFIHRKLGEARAELGVVTTSCVTRVRYDQILGTLGWDFRSKVEDEADLKAATLAKKYPLLFDPADQDAVKEYIALIDSKP